MRCFLFVDAVPGGEEGLQQYGGAAEEEKLRDNAAETGTEPVRERPRAAKEKRVPVARFLCRSG